MLHKRRLIPRHHSGRYSSLNCSFYWPDRKSTRLNSSHLVISYAVFCLKKKKNTIFAIHPDQIPKTIYMEDPADTLDLNVHSIMTQYLECAAAFTSLFALVCAPDCLSFT